MLNFEEFPCPDPDRGARRLIIAHGLYGSARNWRAIAKALSKRVTVQAVDMRNHGQSLRSDEMDYHAMAADLAEVIGDRPATVLGHSMGGKAAMVLALTVPEAVEALLIGDIAPVPYDHGAENIRYADDMLSLDLDGLGSRGAADEALAARIEDRALRAFFLQSLAFEETGAEWRLNLPAIRAALPAIHSFPEVEGRYDGPVLALRGANSDYVSEAGRAAFDRFFPQARHMSLKDAGHWLHAERPKAFIATVEAFLDATA